MPTEFKKSDMSLKTKLKNNLLTVGSWVMLRDPISVEVMAASGLDWLAIDMEHAPISIDIAADLIRVGARCGIDMLVRVPDHNVTTIKQVLDAGASGVIVPDVRTVEQAVHILSFIRYPQKTSQKAGCFGNRGAGLARAQGYGRNFSGYFESWNSEAVFIPQIEHIDAIPNASDIAAIDGVDALFVGPYDLSASMGKAGLLDDVEVASALHRVVNAASVNGKVAGFHSVPTDTSGVIDKIRSGVKFVAYSADVFFIRDTIDRLIGELKAHR